MDLPTPLHIKSSSLHRIEMRWSDGHEGFTSFFRLRDACPCAGCKGETILFETYVPPEPDRLAPGRYELAGAETIGGYAVKFIWKDGHDMGLYTWEHLRNLCECRACTGQQ
jgi:DUF971 family protein